MRRKKIIEEDKRGGGGGGGKRRMGGWLEKALALYSTPPIKVCLNDGEISSFIQVCTLQIN